jgi:hypothetical protein
MESIISKCKNIPIQDLKKYLLTKLTSKKMVIVYLEFLNDYHKIFLSWEKELRKKYGKNIEMGPPGEAVWIIYLKSEDGIGGAIIIPKRQAIQGTAYIYDSPAKSKEFDIQKQVAQILARQYWDGTRDSHGIKDMTFKEYWNKSGPNWIGAARGVIHLCTRP